MKEQVDMERLAMDECEKVEIRLKLILQLKSSISFIYMKETICSSVHMILLLPQKPKKPIHPFSYYFRDIVGISKYCNMYHIFEIMVIIRPLVVLFIESLIKNTYITTSQISPLLCLP